MTLKLCVAGLGHGRSYFQLAEAHPRVTLAALVDSNEQLLEREADALGVERFTSVEAMLAAGVADAAVLALPTPAHADTTTACLDAGLHVLQEKPLCATDDEAARIGAAVERSGRVFQVGYEVRSSDLHLAVMEHIARGDIGTVTNVWYNQHTLEKAPEGNWRRSRDWMGGKLFDCAVHYFDVVQQWAGAPLVRLAAMGNLLGATGPCPDCLPGSAAVAMEYANGVRGTFNFGEHNDCNDDASFGIVGTTGRIMGNPWLPEKAGSFELRTHQGRRRYNVVFDGKLCSTGHLGFREQFQNFVHAALDGGPNMCPFGDALAVHKMMRAIDRSLATGAVVAL